MALDKDYFDAIHIDVVKKKYYNANKVEAVFEDIRRQAAALTEENERLRQELNARSGHREELRESVISAQAIYQRIIEKAQQRADAILSEARRESEEIRRNNEAQQDLAVKQVEACLSRVRQLQENAIEEINTQWQNFLIGLYPEEAPAPDKVPADLSDKVDSIARELWAINNSDS
ncbi:MAG: DivIVA domain-containing protein [Oscillospiraceae bacterium]|nr:DivIVA domain-containing protein [Oscillospiraceae bacterium]